MSTIHLKHWLLRYDQSQVNTQNYKKVALANALQLKALLKAVRRRASRSDFGQFCTAHGRHKLLIVKF